MKLQDKSQPVSASPDDGRATEQTEEETPTGVNDQRAELAAEREEDYLDNIPDDINVELPIVIPLRPKTTMQVRARIVDLGRAPFHPVVDEEWFLSDESEQ